MDEEQQTELFKYFPCTVLLCFLDWPWQVFFRKIASRLWKFLPQNNYGCILLRITKKIEHGYKDFDYQKLFRENWLESPNSYKRFTLLFPLGRDNVLKNLFGLGDKNNIQLIFQRLTIREKRCTLFSTCGRDICYYLIDNKGWELLKFFILECTSTKKEITEFKKEVILHSGSKDNLYVLLQVLDSIIKEMSIRERIVEDESSDVKKLCTEIKEMTCCVKK